MKKIIIILGVLLVAFSCKEVDLLKSYGPDDKVAPGIVRDVEWVAAPGGVTFKYTLPDDVDLSHVKAIYYVNGSERNAISSQYGTSLTIEGLPNDDNYEISLFCVDKRDNMSDPVNVIITPETPPVNIMRASIDYEIDFGGFRIKYENPSRAELSIYVSQKDSLSDNMQFYGARVFTQEKGEWHVVGLPNKTNKFQVVIKDKYGNSSEPFVFEDRPWREEYMDKKNFKYVGEPSVYDKDDWYSWMGSPYNLWDDKVGEWNFSQTGGNGEFPHYLCIDLGHAVPIGRMNIQQRLGDGNIFNLDCIKTFDVYGVAQLPIVDRDNPLAGWTKLNDKLIEIIRPSGRQPGEPVTNEDKEAAEKGIMFTIDTPFPRPEVRYIRFVFHNSFGNRNMALLGEVSFWAQWK